MKWILFLAGFGFFADALTPAVVLASGIWSRMGLVWIGLALFGLVLDPDKNLIIISQVIAGVICLALQYSFFVPVTNFYELF